jgi:cytochrome P450
LAVNVIERVVEATLLLAVPWPVWRLLSFRPYRRRVPAKVAMLAGLLASYSVAVIVIAVFAPVLLRTLAILGLAVGMGLMWWLRSGLRGGKCVPPGRLTFLPLAPCRDHRFYQRQAARHGPIFKAGSTLPCPSLRPTVCVVGHQQGLDLLRRSDSALEVWPPAPFSAFIPRGFLRYMGQEDHRVYSQLFRTAMAAGLMETSAPYLQAETRLALRRMAIESDAEPSIGLRPIPYLDRMLFAILARFFLGVSPETETFKRLRSLHGAIGIPRLTLRSRHKRVQDAVEKLTAFLVDHGRQITKQTTPVSDRPSCLLSEIIRLEPHRVDDPTMLGNIIYMLEAGRTDVGGLLMWVLKHLSDHPQWLKAVRMQSSSPPDANDLAARVVKETLRLEQSEYLYRRASDDIDVGHFVVPKGWLIRVCIRDGHQDPAVFDRPESFNPDRFRDRNYAHGDYAPFGLFRHMCIGAQLTQEIGRCFVSELAREFALEAVEDGPPEHPRFHWEPNARFRIRVTRNA